MKRKTARRRIKAVTPMIVEKDKLMLAMGQRGINIMQSQRTHFDNVHDLKSRQKADKKRIEQLDELIIQELRGVQ